MSEEKRFAARARLHVIGDTLEVQTTSELKRDEPLLVDTQQGREVATLIEDTHTITEPSDALEARRLTERDHDQLEKMSKREADALTFAIARANKLKLALKFVSAKLTHDGKFATFYFSAPERVDFRTLVKDLAKRFSMRVEMRQVGVRDAARQVGGIGLCGRKLCCATHLPSFKPISIRLAKDQGLALNQQKLSGACGRLRCCLQYEHEVYSKALKAMPKLHKRVTTPRGIGKVRDLNILTGKVSVLFDDGEYIVYQAHEVERYIPPNQPKGTKPQEPGSQKQSGKRHPKPRRGSPSGEKSAAKSPVAEEARKAESKSTESQDAPKKKRRRRKSKPKSAESRNPDASTQPEGGQSAQGAKVSLSEDGPKKRRRRRRKPKNKDGAPQAAPKDKPSS
jgi:cell fate regulator YaaT (PSP1 superfamily)